MPLAIDMKLLLFALLLIEILAPCSFAHAEMIYGRVVSVSDGDTISILTDKKNQIKIRLTEIDAPEKDQPYGKKSKEALSALVFNKDISVSSDSKDRYGRTLGRIYTKTTDVNLYMVSKGYAWAYTKYLTDQSIKVAETKARTSRLGLWALQKDQTVPPWEWRKKKKIRNRH